jgi:hypothetical protein
MHAERLMAPCISPDKVPPLTITEDMAKGGVDILESGA